MHIEFRHLRTIKAIHEHGGVARAADILNITQSALSHQIKGLEDQAGVELFVRRSKPMRLSAAGRGPPSRRRPPPGPPARGRSTGRAPLPPRSCASRPAQRPPDRKTGSERRVNGACVSIRPSGWVGACMACNSIYAGPLVTAAAVHGHVVTRSSSHLYPLAHAEHQRLTRERRHR